MAQEKHKRFRDKQQMEREQQEEGSREPPEPTAASASPEQAEAKDPFVALAEKYSSAPDCIHVNLLIPQKGTTRLRISSRARIEEIRKAFQPLTMALICKGKRLSDDRTLRECRVSDEDIIHCWKSTVRKAPAEEPPPDFNLQGIAPPPLYVLCAMIVAILAVLWGLLVTTGKKYFTPFSTLLLFALTGGAGILMREIFLPTGNGALIQ